MFNADPVILRYVFGGLVLLMMALRNFKRRNSHNKLIAFHFWFFSAASIGLLIWGLIPLFTRDQASLNVSQIAGDIFIYLAAGLSWMNVWYLYFKQRFSYLFVAIPIFFYLVFMSFLSVVEVLDVPPVFSESGEYLIPRSTLYGFLYGPIFLGAFPVGINLMRSYKSTKEFVGRFQSIAYGLAYLILSISNLLFPFISDAGRNSVQIVMYLLVLATVILAAITIRRRAKKT